MHLDASNYKELWDTISCHDAVIKDFSYDFLNNRLHVGLSESDFCTVKSIVFSDVMFFRATCFEPWGKGADIFDFSYLPAASKDSFLGNDFRTSVRFQFANDPQAAEIEIEKLVIAQFLLKSGDKIVIAFKSATVECK